MKNTRIISPGITYDLFRELKVSGTFSLTSTLYSCGWKSKNRLLRIRREAKIIFATEKPSFWTGLTGFTGFSPSATSHKKHKIASHAKTKITFATEFTEAAEILDRITGFCFGLLLLFFFSFCLTLIFLRITFQVYI